MSTTHRDAKEGAALDPSPSQRSSLGVEIVPRRAVSDTALVKREPPKGRNPLRPLSTPKLGMAMIEIDEPRLSKPEEVGVSAAYEMITAEGSDLEARGQSAQGSVAPPQSREGVERIEPFAVPAYRREEVRSKALPVAEDRRRIDPDIPLGTSIRTRTMPPRTRALEIDDDGVPTRSRDPFDLQCDLVEDITADVSPRRVAQVLESLTSVSQDFEAAEYLSVAERLREYAELLGEIRVLGAALGRARGWWERLWASLRAWLFARRVLRAIAIRERTLLPCVVSGRSLLMEIVRTRSSAGLEMPPRFTLRIYGEFDRERTFAKPEAPPVALFEVTRVALGRGPRRLNPGELASLFWPHFAARRERRGAARADDNFAWAKRKGLTAGPVPSPVASASSHPGDCARDAVMMFLQSNLSDRFRDRALRVLHDLRILSEVDEVFEPTLESEIPEDLRDTDASLCLDHEVRYAEERKAIEGKPWFAGSMTSAAAEARFQKGDITGPNIVFFIYQAMDMRQDFVLAFAWLEDDKSRVTRHSVLSFQPDGSFAPERMSKCFRRIEDVANMMTRIGYAPLLDCLRKPRDA